VEDYLKPAVSGGERARGGRGEAAFREWDMGKSCASRSPSMPLRSVKIAPGQVRRGRVEGLDEADAELQRTLTWLETEQLAYWQAQQRNRTTLVGQAREALRNRTLYKDMSGRTPAAVEEKKALEIALRRLEEVEQKIGAVKKWTPRLKIEINDLPRRGAAAGDGRCKSDVPLADRQLEGISLAGVPTWPKDPAAREVVGRGRRRKACLAAGDEDRTGRRQQSPG